MEETGRLHHSRKGRERGSVSEEAERWRSTMCCDGLDYSRNDKCKPDKGFHDRRSTAGSFSSSPRGSGYSPLSSSPAEFNRVGQRGSYERREGFWRISNTDGAHARERTWRERPSGGVARWRKDSYQEEDEDLRRFPEGWSRQQELINLEGAESVPYTSGQKRRMREKRRNRKEKDEEGGAPVIDESALSEKELLALYQAEERIGKEGIFRLKSRSLSSPRAQYNCTLCGVLLDSVSAAHKHVKEKWHKKRARDKHEEVMLTEIPPPEEKQAQAVGLAVQKELLEHGLSEEDVERRRSIVLSMEEVIMSFLPDCSLRLYGSSCTKFGFKDSDVNIDIQFPSDMHQPDVLLLVHDILSKSSLYVDLEADFHAKVPVVVCKEKQSGLICKVSAGNDSAHLTTVYLSALAKQEPRLYPLVLGLRRWAQICHIDHPEEGGLPPYVLALMVIHFLQQRKEPVLPTYLGSWIKEFSLNKAIDFRLTGVENGHVLWAYSPTQYEGTASERFHKKGKSPLVFETERQCSVVVGRLWLEMLRFYSLECDMPNCVIGVRINGIFSRESKDWPKKRIAIEDPYAVKRNVARTVNSQVMFEYILHCLKTTYKYFAQPGIQQSLQQTSQKQDELSHKPREAEPSEESSAPTDCSVTNVDHGQTDSEPCLVEEGVCEAVLDDSDYVAEAGVCEGLTESNLETTETDVAPELEESEDVDPTNLPHFPQEQEPEVESLSDSEAPMLRGDSDDERLDREDEESGSADDLLADLKRPFCRRSQSDEDEEEEEEDEQWLPESFTTEEEQCLADGLSSDLLCESVISPDEKEVRTLTKDGPPSVNQTETLGSPAENFTYEFSKKVFTRGKSHTIVCSLCKRDGHLKRDCPEDFKRVELDSLPPMTPKFLRVLNEVCTQCYRDFAPDETEEKVREYIVQDLEKFIRHQFEGAKLRLFGSSKNGFGFRKSDLDICMVLEGQETSEGLNCLTIIDSLARVLRKHSGLCNILPITTAKVPIVKFLHAKSGLEGDISLYNTLALHNTHLLATYATIDPRVKYLCYVMKVFSKVCDIGDASRGSLSSYAYTLMVLFFLQQRNPPVIPVLQEIYDGQKKPEILVDGWNVYFFDKLEELPRRWPEYRSNMESVGQLWLGLLRFYTEEFDFREHVICIRRKQLLTTFKKQWTSKYIVIEDPFDLNHNLGAGLSRRMTNFIMKAFINGRRVFGTPIKVYPPEYPSKMEYFFDPEVLTEGELAPNDRCCRICGKIGHFMKDCPLRRKVRHKRDPLAHEDVVGSRWQHGDQDRVRAEPQEAGRRRPQEDKRCFICGSYSHIKRECPQYKGPAGSQRSEGAIFSASPSAGSHVKNFREKQCSSLQEEKRQRQPKVTLSPQAGSLVNRHMTQGRASPRKSPMD